MRSLAILGTAQGAGLPRSLRSLAITTQSLGRGRIEERGIFWVTSLDTNLRLEINLDF
jgi:hypothetical protein